VAVICSGYPQAANAEPAELEKALASSDQPDPSSMSIYIYGFQNAGGAFSASVNTQCPSKLPYLLRRSTHSLLDHHGA